MPDYSICWETALDLGARIRSGDFTASEVAETFLGATGEFNPPVNAVVTLDEEGAMERARHIDDKLRAGKLKDSPLAGVPFLAKDLDVTAGIRTTFGSRIQKDYVPRWDMVHIARLKEAGCVLLGKTNTPEDGMLPNTYNDVFGVTRNPWNLDRGPGGSSGGSAAAAACGFAPLTTGSDGGGSIRTPASFCGVFGFKPTFGTIPFGPKGIGICNTIGHLGPITRNVADAAAMTDAMAGADERDRASLAKAPSLLEGLARSFKPAKVGYSFDLGYAPVHSEIRRLFENALETLREAGWPLEEVQSPIEDPAAVIDTTILYEWGTIPMLMADSDPEHFALHTVEAKEIVERRRKITIEELWAASRARKDLCTAMGVFFETYDLLITPTLTRTAFEAGKPWPVGKSNPDEYEQNFHGMLYPFNLTGDPACSIPMGLTEEGLPAGLQIVGPRHADLRVLQAALAYERLNGASDLRPPHGVKT